MHEIKYVRAEKPVSVQKVRDFLRTTRNFFALLDQEKLVSEVQIRAALEHVERNSSSKVRDAPTLLMLYISGTSQIAKAYESVGINSTTSKIAVVFDDENDFEDLLESFPSISEISSERLPEDSPDMDSVVFGRISQAELELS